MDRGAHDTILGSGGRRQGTRNEIRLVVITGFGEVDLIPDPMGVAFRAVACLEARGRCNAQRGAWLLVPTPPGASCRPRAPPAENTLAPRAHSALQRADV